MVKEQEKDSAKRRGNQGKAECPAQASKIWHSTPYSYCSERLSPFGGLLGLVKFMELIRFKEIFEGLYNPPSSTPAMGHHSMVYGFVYWIQPGVAFSVYSDGLDVMFDISRGETSVCNDILAICEFIGNKLREVPFGSNECIARAGMALCEIDTTVMETLK